MMKQEIDKLVANVLLDEGEIYLPSVGTLILVRHAAKRLSSRRLQKPYRELRFTGEQRGLSIVECLVAKAGVEAERAEGIYTEYLSQSMRDGVLTIENLCTIDNKKVQTAPEFENMANPEGRGVVKVKPRVGCLTHLFRAFVAFSIVFALGIAGFVVVLAGVYGYFDEAKDKVVELVQKVQTAEPAAEQAEEVVVAPATEEVAAPVAESVAAPVAEPVVEKAVSNVLPMQLGKSYAVWGVYNELKNAEAAVAWLGKRYPSLEPHIYHYKGKYMVALYELSPRFACGRKVSALRAESSNFKDVWVYTYSR